MMTFDYGLPAELFMAKRKGGVRPRLPGCVKTLRGITAPGILSSTVTPRAKRRKNLPSGRHYDQIRFRFRTAKTFCGVVILLKQRDDEPPSAIDVVLEHGDPALSLPLFSSDHRRDRGGMAGPAG